MKWNFHVGECDIGPSNNLDHFQKFGFLLDRKGPSIYRVTRKRDGKDLVMGGHRHEADGAQEESSCNRKYACSCVHDSCPIVWS